MESCERRIILEMLGRTNWSQTEAADRFKIPLSTLNQKIKRLHIDVKRRREVIAHAGRAPAPDQLPHGRRMPTKKPTPPGDRIGAEVIKGFRPSVLKR